ncbi:MAG TPA: DUF805 domain-containing protein [Croceibacterium sp.]|nr:DUF805 domain-containing protein [Croceibacterium sp.]
MLGSIKYNLSHLLDFSGRDARQTFWFYVLFVFLLNMAVSLAITMPAVGQAMGGAMMAARSGDPAAANAALAESMTGVTMRAIWAGAILGVVNIGLLAAAFVRRLHDADFSGWWALLVGAVYGLSIGRTLLNADSMEAMAREAVENAIANPTMGPQLYGTNPQMAFDTLIGWIPIVLMVGFGVLKSTAGPNRFAEEPVRF